MANELVGQSIAKNEEPTKVPKSSAAPSEAVSAVMGPDVAEAAAAPTQANSLPPGFEPIDETDGLTISDKLKAGGFEPVDEMDGEFLPSYADGSSPDAPVNKSPLSITDRLALTTGNKVGNLRYLKNQYGDAKLDKHGNYTVLKDGAWYRADANGLGDGDAWERTKELIKDTADLADIALATGGAMGGAAAGAAAGMGVASGPGSVAGAALGGAAAEGVRSSLGRLIGTYDATPEEQVKDIGWEGLLAMGGQTVALGAKPVLGMMKASMENFAKSASNVGKEMSSGLWAQLTGQPRWALRRAMDAPADVLDKAQEAIKLIPRGASPVDAIDVIQGTQNTILEAMAGEADQALKSQYKKELGNLVSKVPQDFSADVKTMVNETKIALHDAGYGKIVGTPGKEKFIPMSSAEIAQKMGVPEAQVPKIIGPDTREALNKVAGILNEYSSFGTLSGKVGAAKTVELKRAIGESFQDLIGSEVPASIKQVVLTAKKSLEEGIGKAFTAHGVGEDYIRMNAQYATQKDAVDMLVKAVSSKNPQEVDLLVKKLVSKSGSFKSLKDEAKSLANLLPDGSKRMESLVDWEAAKSFLDFVPKTFGGNSATTLGKIAGAVTQQSNPRAIGQQIKYGAKTVNFLKNLGPRQLNALLGNDQAMQALFQIPAAAAGREERDAQDLLKLSGVKP